MDMIRGTAPKRYEANNDVLLIYFYQTNQGISEVNVIFAFQGARRELQKSVHQSTSDSDQYDSSMLDDDSSDEVRSNLLRADMCFIWRLHTHPCTTKYFTYSIQRQMEDIVAIDLLNGMLNKGDEMRRKDKATQNSMLNGACVEPEHRPSYQVLFQEVTKRAIDGFMSVYVN